LNKTVILDTNVYLTDVGCIMGFGRADIAIPTVILDEIDKHKHRQDVVGLNARLTNRALDSLRTKGSFFIGVPIGSGKGKIFAASYDPRYMPAGMNSEDSDNKIIATALKLRFEGRSVVVVSRDINMRLKCDSLGLAAIDYDTHQVIESVDKLFDGTAEVEVADKVIDKFYEEGDLYLTRDQGNFYPNQFMVLAGKGEDNKKSAICKFTNFETPLRKVNKFKNVWGFEPRNKEQQYSMDLLFDKDVHIVSLVGQAGTGKTLLATACGLEQVLNTSSNSGGYNKLIITRPVQPMGKDIGFLPGTLEEKMMPWIAPIRDNLEHLFGDRTALDMQIEQGTIEIEAMTYIRGRSISNAFMIVDEAQNLTPHELKTIITRVGHDTKLVLTGDVQQIDNSYVDAESNGLTYAIEKFKEYQISGHITLKKGERSKLATLASEIL